jgi:hypothetical protein
MSQPYQLYVPNEALVRRVSRLPEMYTLICSQKHADVTYRLQVSPCFYMGNVSESEAGVTEIIIEAWHADVKFVGRLIAYVFDMDRLVHLGLMDVFRHSERTQALFKMVYQGDYQDDGYDYLFQPAFLEALKAQMTPEVIQEREAGGFGMDEYCTNYHMGYLHLLESFDSAYGGCEDEMLGVLKGLGDGFDFLVLFNSNITYES